MHRANINQTTIIQLLKMVGVIGNVAIVVSLSGGVKLGHITDRLNAKNVGRLILSMFVALMIVDQRLKYIEVVINNEQEKRKVKAG